MKKFTFLVLSIIYSLAAVSQTDSLITELNKFKNPDKKITFLFNSAQHSLSINDTNKSLIYSDKAIEIALKNNIMSSLAYFSKAEILFNLKRYDESIELFEKVKEFSENNKDSLLLAKSLLKIARITEIEGRNNEIYSKTALPIIRSLADSNLLAENLLLLSNSYRSHGDFKNALECNLESLKIREKMKDLNDLSESLYYLGWTYLDCGKLDNALAIQTRNLNLRKEMNDIEGIGKTFLAIGRCYQYKMDYKTAFNFYLDALTIFQKPEFMSKTRNHDFWIGVVYNDIGWNFNEWNKPEKALPYLLKSLKIQEVVGSPERLTYINQTLGETYLNLQNYDLAENYLLKVIKLSQKGNLRKDRMVAYHNLASLYNKKGNSNKVFIFNEKYNSLKDSIFNEENQREIRYIQAKFEFEKKDIEAKLLLEQLNLEKALGNKRFLLVLITNGALLFTIFLIIVLYRNNLQKKKLNNLLQEQKEEITAQNEEISSQNVEINNKNEELNQLIEEVQKINEYLDDLVKQRTQLLEKQNQQLREYAFINAHKLRAPLASILGLVNIVKLSDYKYIDKNLIEHIRISTEKLDEIIHEIQDVLEEVKIPD